MAYFELTAGAWALLGAALVFNVGVTALYYIISNVIQSPSQIALAKENIVQLIFTGFIIAVFLSFQGVFTSLAGSLVCFGETGIDCSAIGLYDIARYALEILKATLMSTYSKMYAFESLVAILSSLSMTMGVFRVFLFVFSIHISPFEGLTMIANVQVTIVEAIGYSLGIIVAKGTILDMVQYAMPAVFFPLGVFMRGIPWLRTTGSTIIAMCFTMFFLLPLAIIFTNYVVFDMYESTPLFVHFDSPDPMAELCGESVEALDGEEGIGKLLEDIKIAEQEIPSEEQGALANAWDVIASIGSAIASLLTIVIDMGTLIWKGAGGGIGGVASFFYPIAYFKAYFNYLILEILVAAQFLVLVLVTTILEFIIIVTGHRSISAAIGGETEIFGLSKII